MTRAEELAAKLPVEILLAALDATKADAEALAEALEGVLDELDHVDLMLPFDGERKDAIKKADSALARYRGEKP